MDMTKIRRAQEARVKLGIPAFSKHVFPEWVQIMGAFYQPEPETLEDYPAESYLCHNGLGWLSGGSRRLVFEERDATGQARQQ